METNCVSMEIGRNCCEAHGSQCFITNCSSVDGKPERCLGLLGRRTCLEDFGQQTAGVSQICPTWHEPNAAVRIHRLCKRTGGSSEQSVFLVPA